MLNVIVADDHTVVREALCELLKNKGECNIIGQADDGQHLLSLLQGGHNADLIIMDINMPRLNGIETLKAIGERFENSNCPPVLILSANDDRQYVSDALNAGAKGFVPKDADLNELMFAISSIMNGKVYLSPTIIAPLFSQTQVENTPVDPETNPFDVLTKREIEITKYLANGLSNREIGEKLFISIRTVDTHRSNILHKLNIRNNSDLTRLALAHKLI